jgi:hypothetical protein
MGKQAKSNYGVACKLGGGGGGGEELYFMRFDTKNDENLLNFSMGRNKEQILKIYKLTLRQKTNTK